MIHKILLTLISTIVFGLIHGSFLLFAEEKIQKPIKQMKYFNKISAGLLTGGISAACAIMFSSIVEKIILHYSKNMIKHPLLDSMGVIIGTFIVIILYKLFTKNNNNNNNNKNK